MKNHRCYSTKETINGKSPKNSPPTKNCKRRPGRPPCAFKHLCLMELWLPPRALFSLPNPHRTFPSYTLYFRHRHSLLIRGTHLPGRKLRMTYPKYTRQRRFLLFHLHLPSHWPGTLLRVILIQRDVKHRSYPSPTSNNDSIRRLCSSLRTNILLRCNRYYKPSLSRPIRGQHPGSVNLRGLFR